MSDVLVELQTALRSDLKDPFGPIYSDAEALLAAAGEPLVTVGDVVTYHVIQAGTTPAVALVDDRTERGDVDPTIAETIRDFDGFDREVTVDNPAATITAEMARTLRSAIESTPDTSTLVVVDGEEDLAALPAILAAPVGASVVYGQPGEGMVLVSVDDERRGQVAGLLRRMHGDPDRLLDCLDFS